MKKLISLSVFLVFFGINQTVLQAQNSGNTTIQANALVLDAITVASVQPLEFGQLFDGETSTVKPGTGNISNPNGQLGIVNILGSAGALVDAAINFPTSLDNGGESINIDNPEVFLNDETNNLSGNIINPAFSLTGNDNLFFTGSITPNGVSAGSYQATIEVTITYQ